MHKHTLPAFLVGILLMLIGLQQAVAMPTFARKYDMSCTACHAAFPRLNEFGAAFAAQNMRLGNWKEASTSKTGDPRLVLPDSVPLALRAQGYTQFRDDATGSDGSTEYDSRLDFQSPYLIKLLASAPLSDHITFYGYGIMAEKGGNGEFLIEDAWFSHDDLFGSGAGLMLGQFQVSDLMFPRETRLTFQDFMVYRMAGVTYDRGLILDRGFGPVEFAVGAVNGNGVSTSASVSSPGYRRSDALFDNDSSKSIFARVGTEIGGVSIGLFGLTGRERFDGTLLGTDYVENDWDSEKRIAGLDLSGKVGYNLYWFFQGLVNEWDDVLERDKTYQWNGMFLGVDYIHSPEWAWSALYNRTDAGDLDGTGTIYNGIDMNSLTLAASYYFMTNVKLVLESNIDMLDTDHETNGHNGTDSYVLLGFDAAF
ncbi:MAG: hypothetical protein R6X15_04175 [Pseudomonadota bacterium]